VAAGSRARPRARRPRYRRAVDRRLTMLRPPEKPVRAIIPCCRMGGMILVGQYDSPFVRRVAVSLRLLGFAYEHDTRSVFGDFDSMRRTNPLGRIPSLVLEDGEVLIDSVAI